MVNLSSKYSSTLIREELYTWTFQLEQELKLFNAKQGCPIDIPCLIRTKHTVPIDLVSIYSGQYKNKSESNLTSKRSSNVLIGGRIIPVLIVCSGLTTQ